MNPVVQVKGLSKRFPGVQALDDVSVSFHEGSVHALLGENGAGKSTLGKILAGLYQPDGGEILFAGKPVHFRTPNDAVHCGIAMVHQELLFAENLSVAENLCLAEMPAKGFIVDRQEMRRRATEWLATIGAQISPDTILGDLPISKQQLVQVAGGIGRGAKVLIFDEPTSSLSQTEADKLLELIRELKSQGITCIYVSHRLDEIFAICDTVTVLRDGKLVDTCPIEGMTRDDLVRKMIGRELAASLAEHDQFEVGAEVLSVQGLSSLGKFQDVSFSLRGGEILALAGLVGAGRTEVAEALFGLDGHSTGTVKVHGKTISAKSPKQAMALGMGLVPEDRKRHGLVLSMTAKENVSLPTLGRLSTAGWVKTGSERALAQRFFEKMRVKAPTIDASTIGLSGGNQQKLVLAKWMAADTDLLIVDEPTRGVDVGAKAEIHNLVRQLAAEGKAVLLISSDLPELLALATRILVMREGRIVGELPAGATEEAVMRVMAGIGLTSATASL
ncbi:MAG: sugar ABC transporter ATP-binding protein [Fimbriimonas sp.]